MTSLDFVVRTASGRRRGWLRGKWRALSIAVVAAAMLVAAPAAQAELVRLGLNGARPSELPIIRDLLDSQGLTQQSWREFAYDVGKNWIPSVPAVAVDYPAQLGPFWGAGARSGDESSAIGQQNLHAAILAEKAKGNTVAVAGLSMGTLVIDKELAYLAENPDLFDKEDVTFYLFGGEARGFGQTYVSGVTVPVLGISFPPIPETKFTTVVVYAQWDGWANPPDRPWHLLSVANAVMGALLTINGSNDHSLAALENIDNAVLVSETTNSVGGQTITYMIPGANLPLTRPLRAIGVPGWFVDELDKLLMPFVAAGYSSMTPQWGLHIERGQFVWGSAQSTVSPATSVPEDTTGTAEKITTAGERSETTPDPKTSPTAVEAGDTEAGLQTGPHGEATKVPDNAPETDTADPGAADTTGADVDSVDSAVEEDDQNPEDDQSTEADGTGEPGAEESSEPDTESESGDADDSGSVPPGPDTAASTAAGAEPDTDRGTAAAAA